MWRRKRMLEELERDIRDHIEQETQDNIGRGMSPEEARYAARRKFGNVLRVKEDARAIWTVVWLEQVLQDLRLAVRQMRRSPGFAIAAVVILALGITANVIVFGVLRGLVLGPLDMPRPDRVMQLQRVARTYPVYSYPDLRDLRDGNTVFSAVAGFELNELGMEANGNSKPVLGYEVTGQYFEVVGIKPFLGRLLERADDDHPGAADAAVISWPAWKSDFGADPNIVGKTIRLDKHPYTVVGVTPQGFHGTENFVQPDVFVPMANEALIDGINWLEDRGIWTVLPIVRIRDGVTLAQAQAELDTIAARIRRQYPKDEEDLEFTLTRPGLMGDFLGAPVRGFLAGLMVLAGIVLLAACVNLGSLFAARTADRIREIAIRIAIGSSRWRILRQVLVEAVVISILGGACACGLAWLTLTGLASWRPPFEFPLRFFGLPQPSLILIALLISTLAGFLFGVMPIRQIFKTDPNQAIKSGGSQFSEGRRWALRDVLLAAQIALCCVTITAAFVSLRGLDKSLTMNIGINPQDVVRTVFHLKEAAYSSTDADRFQRQVLERVSQLPGVEAAGYANYTPLSMESPSSSVFSQQATDFRDANKAFDAHDYDISPGYLTASGTVLLTGRDVSFADAANKPAVAIVNQEFARRLFHFENAIGRYFKNGSGALIQIVGIAADGKYLSRSEGQEAAAFFPISQRPDTKTSLVVRTRRDTGDMVTTIRNVLGNLDPAVPIRQSGDWKSQLALSLFPSQVATIALGIFGAFGLLLSITGTFGLASYTVNKRLRELSIRAALGAEANQILSAALGRMLILLGTGSVVGILLGAATSRVLSAIVYQASAQDPLVLAAVVFTTLLAGLLSVANPVRRALHIDPAQLLREQ